MIRDTDAITVRGQLKPGGQIQLDEAVPLPPGPVEVTVRPAKAEESGGKKKRSILDLAGTGRQLFRGIDVDKAINELRNEWDRKVR